MNYHILNENANIYIFKIITYLYLVIKNYIYSIAIILITAYSA